MFIRTYLTVIFSIAVLILSSAQAQNQNPSTSGALKPEASQPGWLGVSVRPLSRELKAQLAPLILADEGLLIDWVEKNSPAQQAGIKRFDVLLSFDGQRLYSTQQLANLVHHSNANKKVQLEVIQQGQMVTLNTNLAPNKRRILGKTYRQPPYYPPVPGYQPQPQLPPSIPFQQDSSDWDMFESVEVKTLADGRYRAEVSYKDKANEIKSFTFEGKKQEIIQQIEQLKELPLEKKRALIRALNFEPGNVFGIDQFDFGNDFFNSPFFNQNPFNQPFMMQPDFRDRFNSSPWGSPPPYAPWQFHLYPDKPKWNYQK